MRHRRLGANRRAARSRAPIGRSTLTFGGCSNRGVCTAVARPGRLALLRNLVSELAEAGSYPLVVIAVAMAVGLWRARQPGTRWTKDDYFRPLASLCPYWRPSAPWSWPTR